MAEPRVGIGSQFGQYRLITLLGQGGMGEVYEAHDTSKDRTVALKILPEQLSADDQFRTRFQRESRAAAILQEPHVIPIHDWGEIDGKLYIDMRLVQGQDLHELLKQGPLEPARAVAIVGQIASALDAAHAEGLVHRDIKPQNILVTPADFAYLVDFGIAEGRGDTKLTMAGTAIGSFAYMAPERFEDRPATAAIDVYSLAGVLYEALTGDSPFGTRSMEQLIAAHLSAPPPRPSVTNARISPLFDDVVARGMAKEPDDRYGSAGALGRAAERALRAIDAGPITGPTAVTASAATFAPTQISGPGWRSPQSQPNHVSYYPSVQQVSPNEGSSQSSRPWLIPAAIAVVVAVLLAGIGVMIGLLAQQKQAAPTTSSPSAGYTVPSQAPVPSTGSPSLPAPPPQSARPALVTGPDSSANHDSCDAGFSLDDRAGFGAHSGRGTAETSCYFAYSVLMAYWKQYNNAVRTQRTVSAPGRVDCRSVGSARCDGENFIMQCVAYGSDNWITCSGGNNARVYLF